MRAPRIGPAPAIASRGAGSAQLGVGVRLALAPPRCICEPEDEREEMAGKGERVDRRCHQALWGTMRCRGIVWRDRPCPGRGNVREGVLRTPTAGMDCEPRRERKRRWLTPAEERASGASRVLRTRRSSFPAEECPSCLLLRFERPAYGEEEGHA